jgi:syntaxin-binding protein 1
VATCVALGEYPTIRYYSPPNPLPTHESHVLCYHLAEAVQREIDEYAKWHQDFPPPSNRPRGALYIVDRSMDLYAPFLHEFTYQAMAHDLLPIKDGDKVTYKTIIKEGEENAEEKEIEIGEKDKLWTQYRHTHMKDTIAGIMGDFQKFLKDNPHFANSTADTTNINTIKTMLAGLPQFQEMKEAYSLHLNMATASMDVFQKHQLSELASLEQTLATGIDEDYKKPKNVADQTIRMLDEDAVVSSDRLRLIAMYLLYKDGLLPSDIRLLCNHARLPPQDEEVLRNMELLGARIYKQLKDIKPPPQPLFPRKPQPPPSAEDSFLSRFETNLKLMLEQHVAGTLDPTTFPYTRPDPSQQQIDPNAAISAASLRSAKPTWAKSKLSSIEPRQRVIVFMAGGATYSEARACYEITNQTSRDVVLITSHMLSPSLWMRQLGDLSQERRRLGIPADLPAKIAPKHLFEDDRPKPPPVAKSPQPSTNSNTTGGSGSFKPPSGSMVPPVQQMQNLRVNGSGSSHSRPGSNSGPGIIKLGGSNDGDGGGKLKKDKKEKKHHFHFGSSKK